jgi:hypothetical protein
MRKMTMVAPIVFPVLAIAAAGFVIAQAGCSSSPAPADNGNDSGAVVDSAVPGPDGAPPAPDAATCAMHLPAGFTNVVASSSDTDLGDEVSMALDENDDPMFAYLVYSSDNATLEFVRWDPCAGAFTTPMVVDSLLTVDNDTGVRQVSLAYDPSTKEIGIAYQKVLVDPGYNDAATIWLATRKPSDAAFTPQMVSEGESGDGHSAGTPSLAMSRGALFVAYVQNNYLCGAGGSCSGIWFLESTTTADAGAEADAGPPPPHLFTHSTIQYGGDVAQARFDSVSVAVDSNGTPAVAFYQPPPTGYNTTLLFWRRDMAEAVPVTDTNDVQNDSVDLTLRFDGTKPRVAGHISADDPSDYDLTYVASDDGATWAAPIRVPRDGTAGTAFTSALALDGKGNAALAADTNTGSGDNVCGDPYLARSSDGTTWSACGADTTKTRHWSVDALSAAYGGSRIAGKLALGFHNSNIQGEQAGVVYWQDQ